MRKSEGRGEYPRGEAERSEPYKYDGIIENWGTVGLAGVTESVDVMYVFRFVSPTMKDFSAKQFRQGAPHNSRRPGNFQASISTVQFSHGP
ncbi:MAG: hypothetical protein KC587_00590 [Nitrospira sp.]|nr:hypothetical protein [Nitrospira sp.]